AVADADVIAVADADVTAFADVTAVADADVANDTTTPTTVVPTISTAVTDADVINFGAPIVNINTIITPGVVVVTSLLPVRRQSVITNVVTAAVNINIQSAVTSVPSFPLQSGITDVFTVVFTHAAPDH
ncbi:hypothetical protein LSAT2_007852, partial [Lamellibrachia satsuma]